MTGEDVKMLVLESRRLHDELLRTVAKLQAFSEQLIREVASMKGEDDGNERRNSGVDSAGL